jgi:hypothetical protein
MLASLMGPYEPPAQPFPAGRAGAPNASMQRTEPPLAMPPGVPPRPRRVPPNKGGLNELPRRPSELSSDDTLSQRLMEIAHAQRHEAASAIQLALHQSARAGSPVNRQQARAEEQQLRAQEQQLRLEQEQLAQQQLAMSQQQESLRLRGERLARARSAASLRNSPRPSAADAPNYKQYESEAQQYLASVVQARPAAASPDAQPHNPHKAAPEGASDAGDSEEAQQTTEGGISPTSIIVQMEAEEAQRRAQADRKQRSGTRLAAAAAQRASSGQLGAMLSAAEERSEARAAEP